MRSNSTVVAALLGIAVGTVAWLLFHADAADRRVDDGLQSFPAWLPYASLLVAFPIGYFMGRVMDRRFRTIVYYASVWAVVCAATICVLQGLFASRFEVVYVGSAMGWLGVAVGAYGKLPWA